MAGTKGMILRALWSLAAVVAVLLALPVAAGAASSLEPVYSHTVGGSEYDDPSFVGSDRWGNVYLAGVTTSEDFPQQGGLGIKPGPPEGTPGNVDYPQGFVIKYTPSGDIVYSTVITRYLSVHDIAVDRNGGVYFTGITGFGDSQGPDWERGTAVLKLSPSGDAVEYTTILAQSEGQVSPGAIAVDEQGRAYLALGLDGPHLEVGPNAYRASYPGGPASGYLAILDPAGNVSYSTFFGGSGRDGVDGVKVTADGSLFVFGSTESDSFGAHPGLDARDPASDSSAPYVIRFSPDLSGLSFAAFLVGEDTDFHRESIRDVAVAADGSILLAGSTTSKRYQPIDQPYTGVRADFDDVLYAKLTGDGAMLIESGRIGGMVSDSPALIVPGSEADSATIFGRTDSADFLGESGGAGQSRRAAFVVRLAEGRATSASVWPAPSGVQLTDVAPAAGGGMNVAGLYVPEKPKGTLYTDAYLASLGLQQEVVAPEVTARRQQRQRGARIQARVSIRASEPLSVRAWAHAKTRRSGRRVTVRFRADPTDLEAGEKGSLKLRPKARSDRRSARRALRGRRGSLRLVAKLRFQNEAGATATEKRKIRLR